MKSKSSTNRPNFNFTFDTEDNIANVFADYFMKMEDILNSFEFWDIPLITFIGKDAFHEVLIHSRELFLQYISPAQCAIRLWAGAMNANETFQNTKNEMFTHFLLNALFGEGYRVH